MSEELVVIAKGQELEFFTGGGLDPFLAEVKTMVENFEHDMTTKKGRDATRAFAAKITTFKGKVEKSGVGLVEPLKTQTKAIDEARKHSRDTLDALKKEARKPLTDWEQIDKDRIAKHQENLESLRNMVNVEVETAAAYSAAISATKAVKMGRTWEEFAVDAMEAQDEVLEVLECGLTAATKSEADAAELERLRKEAADREQKERDEKIAREATETAECDAAEREAQLERDIQTAKAQAEQADRDRIAADKQAALDQAAAVEQGKKDEAARIQGIADDEAEKQAKLEANKRHTNKVQKQVRADFQAAGFSEESAKDIVIAIAAGNIANVTINY